MCRWAWSSPNLATSFLPLALLILAVLGAIMFGLATPSESAAIGALGSLLLALAYRSLTWTKLKESVYLTARTSAMVGWLFIGSFIFSAVFAALGGDDVIKDFVVAMDLSPLGFMIAAQIIIFILGWPLEWTEIIVIFVPIFLPLLEHFGIDPLFFGLLIALNIQTSFLSPPVAMAPFYLEGRGAAPCDDQPDLRRRHAVHPDRAAGHVPALCISRNRPVAAAAGVRQLGFLHHPELAAPVEGIDQQQAGEEAADMGLPGDIALAGQ